MKHGYSRIGLIFVLSLLGACSSTTFLYNRLDFLLPWYLGDYADLDHPQEVLLKELLQPYLAWHRMEELPRYLEIIEQIDSSLDDPLQQQDVAEISQALEQAWSRLERESVEWMMELGASLNDEQINYFLERLQEQQEEYEEEYLSRSEQEYREDTYDSLLESFQDALGRLDPAQRQVLQETSESMLRSDAAWLTERARWLVTLQQILKRESGWQKELLAAMAARPENVSAKYEQVYSHNLALIHGATAEVLNSRSEKQDRRLRKKLAKFKKAINTLIKQGEAKRDRLEPAP